MSKFTSTLLTLSDDAFFDLMRNYLGPIKTPFNKHDLIRRLQSFLKKPKTQQRIVELIDQKDAELLSVVWVLNEPTYDELFELYQNKSSYLDLHHQLLNLEDRLLVYRDGKRIRITPSLLPLLEESVLRPGRVFRTKEVSDGGSEPWITDTLLMSAYAFLTAMGDIYRSDGQLRKRTADRLKEQIPALLVADKRGGLRRYDSLFRAFGKLGLVTVEGGACLLRASAWNEFAEISPDSRRALLCASSVAEDPSDCRLYGAAVEASLGALSGRHAIHSNSVERLIAAVAPPDMDERVSDLHAAMEQFGLLCPAGDGFYVPAPPSPDSTPDTPVVVHANFELTAQHEIRFDDGLFIARVARLLRHDRYPRFELTKESYAGALRAGYSSAEVEENLRRLASGVLPPNVSVSLSTWAHEYESLQLYRGVVLRVDETRRHMIDHSDEVQAILERELAPGVYLLSQHKVGELQSLLKSAGVDMIPELPDSPGTGSTGFPGEPRRLADPKRVDHIAEILAQAQPGVAPKQKSKPKFLEELALLLEEQDLTPDQREELTNRIRRRVILSPAQLKAGVIRAEKMEAKGLDYAGKVRIIEQAVRGGGSYLEIIERTSDGSPKRRLVEPSEIKKHGTELLLVGEELPDRIPIELPVSKLRLVRRLRRTLFSE